MEAFLAYESDASYVWEEDEALFTLTLPYVRLNTGSTSSSYGDDNDVEISSDLETYSDTEVIESTAAAAVPLAKVGSQRDLLPFQVHETPQGLHGRGGITNGKKKDAKGVKSTAEIASSRKLGVCILRRCVT